MPVTLCMDIGTSGIRIKAQGHSRLVDERDIVITDAVTGRVLGTSSALSCDPARLPPAMEGHALVTNGKFSDFELASKYFKKITDELCMGRLRKPTVKIAVPAFCGELERLTVRDMLANADVGKTELIDAGYAAALGSGYDGKGVCCTLNLGAGKTDFAVLYDGKLVASETIPVSGDDIDRAVCDYVRSAKGVEIGLDEAARIKMTVCSAISRSVSVAVSTCGKAVSGSCAAVCEVESSELIIPVSDVLKKLTDGIKTAFSKVSAELCALIYDDGIVLCGGMAKLSALDKYLSLALGIKCRLADSPEYAVIRGLEKAEDGNG